MQSSPSDVTQRLPPLPSPFFPPPPWSSTSSTRRKGTRPIRQRAVRVARQNTRKLATPGTSHPLRRPIPRRAIPAADRKPARQEGRIEDDAGTGAERNTAPAEREGAGRVRRAAHAKRHLRLAADPRTAADPMAREAAKGRRCGLVEVGRQGLAAVGRNVFGDARPDALDADGVERVNRLLGRVAGEALGAEGAGSGVASVGTGGNLRSSATAGVKGVGGAVGVA